jgi:hypothetical protein
MPKNHPARVFGVVFRLVDISSHFLVLHSLENWKTQEKQPKKH